MNAYTKLEMPPPKGGHTIEGVLLRNPEVAAKFARLEDDAAAKAAAQEGALAAHVAAQDAISAAKGSLANLQAAHGHYNFKSDSREADELRRAADAVERAQKIASTTTSPALALATDRSANSAQLVADARRFLAGRKTEDVLRLREVSPTVPDDQTAVEAIASKQAVLAARKLRRGGVATALPPADAVKRTLRNQVAAAAARANVELVGLYGGSQGVGFALPTIALDDVEPNKFRPGTQPRIVDMEALACRFWGDRIIADLDAQIDAEYAGEMGDEVLDASEKRTFLAKIDKEIDTLEREIAELIWRAREAGADVEFPSDLPAAAVLGVAA